MFVKPAEGLDIRDAERNDRLPKDKYRLVPDSDYWMRRRRDGDVVTHPDPPISEMEGYAPPEADAEPAGEDIPAPARSKGPVKNEPSGTPAAVGEGSRNATVKDPR
jgi:hypothetical protein